MTPTPAAACRSHDVVITGGGLAGLTLALQLRDAVPGLDVCVVERRAGPAPAAAHKIGESSVEIGAHYFAETLGLKAHLDAHHLRKFGFRFFFSEGRRDLAEVTELGASRYLSTPSWQIDRGIFENFLSDEAVRRGARVDGGTVVRRVELARARDEGARHRVDVERDGRRETISCRWLVDASGRAGLLKRKLDLGEANAHDANAVWFRLAERLEIDDWAGDAAWRGRCDPAARWLSTNHLCGDGYWLWLIPLGSGAHSVGIVADAQRHPLASMNRLDLALEWIARHQPVVHDAIVRMLDRRPDAVLDFAYFKDFSYGCKEFFSPDRWAMTGEAGCFLDPFYSPGSDFIAIANTFITELIANDRAGRPIRTDARFYGELFRSFYESTLTLYRGQYHLFGNERVMPVKVLWDYTYYWGILCQLFFQQRLTDRATIVAIAEPLRRAARLNATMQDLLGRWGARDDDAPDGPRADAHRPGTMLDQSRVPWFAELNRSLADRLDRDAFVARIEANVAQLEALAAEIVDIAQPGGDPLPSALRSIVGASMAGDARPRTLLAAGDTTAANAPRVDAASTSLLVGIAA